jgi:hypothetical protein
MQIDQNLILVTVALGFVTFTSGSCMIGLPLPSRYKTIGLRLTYDGIVTAFAAYLTPIMPVVMDYLKVLLTWTLGAPAPSGFEDISTHITTLNNDLFSLVGLVSSLDAPRAELLARSVGHLGALVHTSLITWTLLETATLWLEEAWIYVWQISLTFWGIPARVGRALGALGLGLALVATPSLAYAAHLAMAYESHIATHPTEKIEDLVRLLSNDPLSLDKVLEMIPKVVRETYSPIMVAYVLFPYLYVSMILLLARGVATAFGGRGIRGVHRVLGRLQM